jgi:hypothetical protein
MFTIKRKDGIGECLTVDPIGLMAACDKLSEGQRYALDIQPAAPPAPPPPPPPATPAPRVNSTFGGELVTDDAAKRRIEATHTALRNAGVDVDTSQQRYATGVRMADIGYATQHGRKREHDAASPLRDAIEALRSTVEAEERDDVSVSAAELGRSLKVNGKITAYGLELTEHAIRGLASRLESPMLTYAMGLRERIANGDDGTPRGAEHATADRRMLADVLSHECKRAGDTTLQLRTRKGPGDVYAVVSPSYTPADAPALLKLIGPNLPRDARGTWAYDPKSTAWELRASVWTPTPVDEQAVGEPFEGYVSFHGKDAGNGRLRGGGGVLMLACLNAGTYAAESSDVARTHRKRVLVDVARMLRVSLRAVTALCEAWGSARDEVLPVPAGVPIGEAIPGFWRYCLTARGSELAGVLPGRTETHIQALTQAWGAERRDRSRVVKSDLAQGWTRYVQDQPGDVRRDAESAIGSWLVSRAPVRYEARA